MAVLMAVVMVEMKAGSWDMMRVDKMVEMKVEMKVVW
jgi:hypothetical protein